MTSDRGGNETETSSTPPRFERGYGLPTAVLDIHETAAYLALEEGTVYRLARRGELPHVRIGRAVRFRVADLDRYLAERTSRTWTAHRKRPQRRISGHK